MKLLKKVNRVYWKYLIFNATNSLQEFTVPSNVTELIVDCVASKGMNGHASGGKGGRVQCTLSVIPNQTLYMMVGIVPTANNDGTYNASDIRTDNTGITDTTSLQSRLIVAGGGGNSRGSGGAGGAGGGTTGANGSTYDGGGGGGGGTQSAGGNGGSAGIYGSSGAKGSFGLGGQKVGGAGGAGWYGGGSGGSKSYVTNSYGGGGGGSSYTDSNLCTNVIHTQGFQNTAGYIRIDFISDSSDCSYTKDEITCYTVKGKERTETVPNVTIVRYTYKGVK